MTSEPSGSLRQRSFVLFCVCRVCAALAFQMSGVAIGWLLYDKTGSAYDLGLLGLCQFLPMVALTLVAGYVADRSPRRTIIMACQFVEASILAVLATTIYLDRFDIATIFVAVACLGAARAFEHPTLAALLPALVPQSGLHRAIALSTSAMQTATIIGPALGGLLFGVGAGLSLACAAAFFLAAGLAMASIRIEQSVAGREPGTFRSIFSGVSFVWGRSTVLGVVSLDLFAVLLGGVTALLPIYARDILHAGPWGLGLLRSAPAVGAVMTSILLSRTSLGDKVGLKMFAAVIAFGLATIVFSVSTDLTLSVIALFFVGASDTVSVLIRMSLIQLFTPDAMRGRVFAVNSLFIGTSNQLGEFESGMAAGLFGPVAAGVLGGVGTIIIALVWMRLFPALRDLPSLIDRGATASIPKLSRDRPN